MSRWRTKLLLAFAVAGAISVPAYLVADGWLDRQRIMKAAREGDRALVECLLEERPSLVKVRERDGSMVLHHAAHEGSAGVVSLLLDAGAEINARDEDSRTPLFLAAEAGHIETSKLLIDMGANVRIDSK